MQRTINNPASLRLLTQPQTAGSIRPEGTLFIGWLEGLVKATVHLGVDIAAS